MSKPKPSATPQPTATTIISGDGTPIHYLTIASAPDPTPKPSLLILHGAIESAPSHLDLALALSADYTIHLPSRRGRPPSGPHGANYGMHTEIEDLTTLLAHTGARYVMGVSSGALVMLHAVQLGFGPRTAGGGGIGVEKVILFEPPLIEVGEAHRAWVARYDAEMKNGDVVGAMVTGMLGAEMGPGFLRWLPRWVLRWLTEWMMGREDAAILAAGAAAATEMPVGMRELAPTLKYDAQLVTQMDILGGSLEGCKDIGVEILLLGGTRSPAYLQNGLDRLEEAIPGAKRVRLNGMHHGATGNRGRGGQPEKVMRVIREFLG